MYGNYVENRDPVGVTATLEAVAQESQMTLPLMGLVPYSVVPSPVKNSHSAQNQNISFVIDTSKFSEETIVAGSLISSQRL